MLGYDTAYYRGRNFHELLRIARQQERVVLTRDSKLTAKGVDGRVILVMENDPFLQLKELLDRDVVSVDKETLLSRCLLCNSLLDRMTRREAEGKVPEFVFHLNQDFYRCPRCHQVYWPGSHRERMEERLKDLSGLRRGKDSGIKQSD